MALLMIRTKVKPDHTGDVEAAAKKMFAALDAAKPAGVRYMSCRLADGVTYVALLEVAEGIENPLVTMPEFQEMQNGLREWLDVDAPPVPDMATVVGEYGFS